MEGAWKEMETRKKKLPIGIENFEKLRSENFYYIDKTGFIRALLNNWGRGESVYPSQKIWKIAEYEYAGTLFLAEWR